MVCALPSASAADRDVTGQPTDGHPHDAPPRGGSPRGFGFLAATVLAAFGAWPMLGGTAPKWTLLALAAALAAVALGRPQWLAPANRVWMAFGRILHRITSPIIITLIYFLVITPTGLLMRAFGKDPLRLKWDAEADTYWLPRTGESESMERQF